MHDDPRGKWDSASRTFDVFTFAENRRFGPDKQRLFSRIRGATLMVGVGTGNDFQFLPKGLDIIGIDISPKMLERAQRKAAAYDGSIKLREMDVCHLDMPDSTFVQKAGFRLRRLDNIYLDIVKAIDAVKSDS